MRLQTALLSLLALGMIGCDGGTGPLAGAGRYALVSVNGAPLPYVSASSTGYNPVIQIGDLVLRPDGTYGFGAMFFTQGTYAVNDEHLRLDRSGAAPLDAVIGGDSVVVVLPGSPNTGLAGNYQPSLTMLFRRSSSEAAAVTAGTWALATINGRGEPLTMYDTVIVGSRYIRRILYDSITVSDGAFFRRHQAEESLMNGTVMGASEYNSVGSYRGRADSLALTFYLPPFSSMPVSDRLSLEQGQLVRRSGLISGTIEERYAPR